MGGLESLSLLERKRCRNIVYSTAKIKSRVVLPKDAIPGKVALVCYGPSLIDTLKDIDPGAVIVSVSAAHDLLLKRGFVPHLHIEFDPRRHKAKHVLCHSKDVRYFLASCVHADLINLLAPYQTALWHAQQRDLSDELIKQIEPKAFFVEGGGSVGLRALELLYACGYREFEIHGMDSSFRDKGQVQWAGPHFGRSAERRDTLTVINHGRRFETSIAFLTYAREFFICRDRLKDAKLTLFGDGLLQHWATSVAKGEAA